MQTNNVRFKFSPEYRQDYASLIQEINKDTYQDLKVMGTLDPQTQVFWQTFKQGNSYVPDLFLSTLSDEETELRLIKFAKIIGMNKDDFREFIIDKKELISGQSINWFSLAKYQTNEQYMLTNINDYTKEQIKSMKKHSIWTKPVSKTLIGKALKKIEFTRKKIYGYQERNEEARQKFFLKIKDYSPERFVYVDEAGVDNIELRAICPN